MTNETAKAVQETAKAVRAGLENIEQIESTAARFLGPVGQLWGLLSDLVREERVRMVAERRIKNWAEILQLAEQARVHAGLQTTRPIALESRFGGQYRLGMEDEDEPSLQELWANLLVNTTRDDSARVNPQRAFGDILKAMDPDDARFFKVFACRPQISQFWYAGVKPHDRNSVSIVHYNLRPRVTSLDDVADEIAEFLQHDREIRLANWEPDRTLQTIDRLRRISLIEYSFQQEDQIRQMFQEGTSDVKKTKTSSGGLRLEGPAASVVSLIHSVIKYRITSLGRGFFAAVRQPEQYR